MVANLLLPNGMSAGIGLIVRIISIALGAAFLWVTARIFKLSDRSFVTPLIVTTIAGIVGYVFGFILSVKWVLVLLVMFLKTWLIQNRYRTGWGIAFLVWLVYTVLFAVVTLGIIALLFGSVIMIELANVVGG